MAIDVVISQCSPWMTLPNQVLLTAASAAVLREQKRRRKNLALEPENKPGVLAIGGESRAKLLKVGKYEAEETVGIQ